MLRKRQKEEPMLTKTRWVLLASLVIAMTTTQSHALQKYTLLSAGYYSGASVMGVFGFSDIFSKVPIAFEGEGGHSWTNPGDPALARDVFINAQKDGSVWDFGLNAVYPLNQTYGPVKFYVFGGPRYAHFDGHFQYVGGNEDFDVIANSWGLGGGLRAVTPLGKGFNAVLQLGVDYYFPTSIYGHDASYYPSNANINARQNQEENPGYTYTYADASSAVNVPRIRPRVMIGIQF
jgi:hypothetical protein